MNSKVDFYFEKAVKWQKELHLLRNIISDCGLTEVLKWGSPCYTFNDHNILLIHVFKDYCAILFFRGVLLNDSKKILIQQTPNVQAARQVRFTNASQIVALETTLKAYIHEAIELEKSGMKVPFKMTTEFAMPEEFSSKLEKLPALKAAFNKLTPGRQRAYLLYFSAARQPGTRVSRIQKCIPKILDGKGLND